MTERPTLYFADVPAAEAWLVEHQGEESGIFVQIAKKGGNRPTPTWEQLVELGLRYGWIDSQARTLDEHCYVVAFTPRRPRSPWSKVNRDTAERLMAEGRMTPRGLAAVEVARANGRWDAAYAGSATFELPADFLQALEASPRAKEFFQTLNRTNHYAVYYRLNDAKKPETRARRIAAFVEKFERGEKLH